MCHSALSRKGPLARGTLCGEHTGGSPPSSRHAHELVQAKLGSGQPQACQQIRAAHLRVEADGGKHDRCWHGSGL
jgi:hypothetical protein